MRFVYPPENHQTAEASTFFIGQAKPNSQVTCNDEPVPLSAQGFIAHQVHLAEGLNRFYWKTDTDESWDTEVERLTAMSFDSDCVMDPWPSETVWVTPDEVLTLSCIAPTGATVTAKIGDTVTIPLTETQRSPVNRVGIFGQHHIVETPVPPEARFYYAEGVIPQSLPQNTALEITYAITTSQNTSDTKASGKLTVLNPSTQRWTQVKSSHAVCRIFPPDGERLTPLLRGVTLPICGRQGEWVGLQVSPHQAVWVQADDLEIDAPPSPLQYLDFVQIIPTPQGYRITLPLAQPVAATCETTPQGVRLKLYRTRHRCDLIRFAPGCKSLDCKVQALSEDTTELTLQLPEPLLGASLEVEEGTIVLSIRTASQKDLVPWVVAIDAGHGGDETGSHAPDGTPEKTLNLALAKALAHLLDESPCFTPVLLREKDTALALTERTNQAQEAKADILLSLHHNALPDGRNPIEEQGVSTYYYHPHAKPLAQALLSSLVASTDFENYGLLYDNLHMCREQSCTSVLLELGFVTHPQDAEKILDKGHQTRVVKAIFDGLVGYFNDVTQS